MFWWKVDPGPCPVDDAPHTTCTSPDYISTPYPSTAQVTVSVSVPLAPRAAPGSSPTALTSTTSFSTKTYRRRKA